MKSSSEIQRRQIFATYIQRMLQRRRPDIYYTPQQTKHWLAWLARQMQQHQLTEFFVERPHLTWLTTGRAYIYGRILALVVGLVFALFAGLVGGQAFGLVGR